MSLLKAQSISHAHPAALLRLHSTGGPSPSKATRSVLDGCVLACQYDALVTNPCRDVARISTKPKRLPTALTADKLRRPNQWLSSNKQSPM
jgi:hypothetical protein